MSLEIELLLKEYGAREKKYSRGSVIYSNESGVEGIYFLVTGKIRIDNSRVKDKKMYSSGCSDQVVFSDYLLTTMDMNLVLTPPRLFLNLPIYCLFQEKNLSTC
ncbi:MAG: hypothetical protein IPM77_15550 [Crocinitomicaceae bacterium]|nr:hypothetical protein [Crocinitomicaceae bacterium]